MAERVGKPDQPGRDLQVEEVGGDLTRPHPAQADLFAPGMDDDHARRVQEQFPEGLERAGS